MIVKGLYTGVVPGGDQCHFANRFMRIYPRLSLLVSLSFLTACSSVTSDYPSSGKVKLSFGKGRAPHSAPEAVHRAVAAANKINGKPYKYGGGHASNEDSGYDCSGSTSYVLCKAGLLQSPMSSAGFRSYGERGPGKWITIYSRSGHVFLTIGGVRFDTTNQQTEGPGWRHVFRQPKGFEARHPNGF